MRAKPQIQIPVDLKEQRSKWSAVRSAVRSKSLKEIKERSDRAKQLRHERSIENLGKVLRQEQIVQRVLQAALALIPILSAFLLHRSLYHDRDGDGDIDMTDAVKAGDLDGDGESEIMETTAFFTGGVFVLGLIVVVILGMRRERSASQVRLGFHDLLQEFKPDEFATFAEYAPEEPDATINTPVPGIKAWRYTFTREALVELRDFYKKEVRGIPGFLSTTLFEADGSASPLGRAKSTDRDLFLKEPALFLQQTVPLDDMQKYLFLLMPNIPRAFRCNKIKSLCSSKDEERFRAKVGDDGISFTAWAIHPDVWHGKHFREGTLTASICPVWEQRRERHSAPPVLSRGDSAPASSTPVTAPTGFAKEFEEDANTPDDSPKRSLSKTNTIEFCESVSENMRQRKLTRGNTLQELRGSHKSCKDIEDDAQCGTEYLVHILDLTPKHLPFLEKLQIDSEAHMRRYYDYNPSEDALHMYFHFPTQDVTSTLHMHVTLNHEIRPAERGKCFFLSDIITHLSKEGVEDVFDLVLARQAEVSNGDLGLINDERIGLVDNCFKTSDESNEVAGMLRIEIGKLHGEDFKHDELRFFDKEDS